MWTDAQQAVIDSPAGHCVVFAGPGSGKTSVLTQHVCRQLRERSLTPQELLIVTFTRQAATELAHRISREGVLPIAETQAIQVGTFHAAMFRALLRAMPDIPVVMRPTEQRRIALRALRDSGLDKLLRVRDALALLNRVNADWPRGKTRGKLGRLVSVYERIKQRARRWDYDDILLEMCRRLASSDRKTIRNWFGPVRYMFIDEFQDTNGVQWEIVRRLVEVLGCDVFVVGDDDQSIYGFRGSSPHWLSRFSEIYTAPRARHWLTVNFRSDREILARSTQLIEHNRQRVHKDLTAWSSENGACCFVRPHDEWTEAKWVVGDIVAQLNLSSTWRAAVLARTRAQLYLAWNMMAGAPMSIRNRVEFRTFHDAKGKEWDSVHLVGAVSSNPYLVNRAVVVTQESPSSALEEERRLFYVAMTRARHRLVVSSPRRVDSRESTPTVFVEESGLINRTFGVHLQGSSENDVDQRLIGVLY